MIGVFVMYLVGKGFFDLAQKFNKNQWGFAIAGVASYYIVQMLAGFALGIYWGWKHGLDRVEAIVDEQYWLLTIITVALGALGCWAFYEFLKSRWADEVNREISHTESSHSDLLDDDLLVG